jgi:hypothetical protein
MLDQLAEIWVYLEHHHHLANKLQKEIKISLLKLLRIQLFIEVIAY